MRQTNQPRKKKSWNNGCAAATTMVGRKLSRAPRRAGRYLLTPNTSLMRQESEAVGRRHAKPKQSYKRFKSFIHYRYSSLLRAGICVSTHMARVRIVPDTSIPGIINVATGVLHSVLFFCWRCCLHFFFFFRSFHIYL